MFSYLTTFVILFLVHVVLFTNLGLEPGVIGGIIQSVVALVLQLPSESKPAFAYTMAWVYWGLLGLWAYVKVRLVLAGRG